jgi:hypothetical protein
LHLDVKFPYCHRAVTTNKTQDILHWEPWESFYSISPSTSLEQSTERTIPADSGRVVAADDDGTPCGLQGARPYPQVGLDHCALTVSRGLPEA